MLTKIIRVLLVINLLLMHTVSISASSFTDVQSSDWFSGYVNQLASAGVISTENTQFFPYRTLSRAELAKMAVRAAQNQGVITSLENPNTPSFCDVPKTDWSYQYVETLAKRNIVSGTTLACHTSSKHFLPNNPISRAEALKILLGTYNIAPQGNANFSDVTNNMWYAGYIAKAVSIGVVNGYPNGTFGPNAFISRAEMSKVLSNLMQYHATPRPTASATPTTPSETPTPSGDLVYNIGTPTLQDLWVSPSGNDENNGSQNSPLRTFARAWAMIPQNQDLTTGYRIRLMSGTYEQNSLPNYLENRFGTARAPIILQGEGNVRINGNLNVFNTKYFYLIGLTFHSDNDVFHLEQGNHVLLRNITLRSNNRSARETIKINQSQYIYIEDSDISGANDNAIDFVAVQYGHVARNKIHDADDWCMYAKGGSAYLRIESNEFYNCGTGGFTAGQGTGFEFMTAPWLHYEAYDIRVVNNVIHDTDGAGLGVNGGYNILVAQNTLYRVGKRSHVIEVVFGLRGCDGGTGECQTRITQGGWGTTTREEFPIGNKNVMIYNNLIYNPSSYPAPEEIFAIYAPRTLPNHARNAPNPAVADTNLQIKGNLIWSGGREARLGIEEGGCQNSNSTCNASQLEQDNEINTIEPQLTNPSQGNFTLANGSNVRTSKTFPLPKFTWNDMPSTPKAPAGNVTNMTYNKYRSGASSSNLHPGAY